MSFCFKLTSCFLVFSILITSCSSPAPKTEQTIITNDSLRLKDSLPPEKTVEQTIPVNDSLDELAGIIAATLSESKLFPQITSGSAYQNYRKEFSGRWKHFDSTRVTTLVLFQDSVLSKSLDSNSTLFYPFSGPDYLYAGRFFPRARHYVLVGLEPVGSLDALSKVKPDSLGGYFNALHTSLNAILKFSFFRTNSMEEDLRKEDLDGVIHVLLLFLKREGNGIISCKPFQIDSLGQKIYYSSFSEQKSSTSKSKGLEIQFVSVDQQVKVLDYLSVNLSDPALKKNQGLMAFIGKDSTCITYLKGASYLLHKAYFSRIRQSILTRSSAVVQDDSGIALHYFLSSNKKWKFQLYGQYTEPISMFRKLYQPSLDSLYQKQGAQPLGFGIGYNFKDNNSNLMIAIPN
jgi:hypothetical protein